MRRRQGFVAVAMVLMNVGMYAFTVATARILIPASFGAVTALLGVLLIVNVVSLGVQATAARRIAVAPPAEHRAIAADVTRATLILATVIMVMTAASSFAVAPLLSLSSPWPVVLCGATMFPLTIYGAQCGITQGADRWGRLGILYLAHGVGRSVVSTAVLLLWPTTTGAMVGLAVGAWVPVLTSLGVLRLSPITAVRPVMAESWHSASALLAYFTLSNTDAVVSRIAFTEHVSGLYAAGLIIAKAASFMPQFVSVVLYPRLARDSGNESRLLAAGLVSAMGAVVTVAVAALPHLALILAGGDAYAGVAHRLWLFALAGSAQALLYTVVFDSLARRSARTVMIVWAAPVLVIAAVLLLGADIVVLVGAMAASTLLVTSVILLAPRPS